MTDCTMDQVREVTRRLQSIAHQSTDVPHKKADFLNALAEIGYAGTVKLGQFMSFAVKDRSFLEAVSRIHNDIRDEHIANGAEYDMLFALMKGEDWFTFMNHGYLPSARELDRFPASMLRDDDEKWRHQVFMYLHLFNLASDMMDGTSHSAGMDLLDVGCGRGGGLSALKRYCQLGRAVGLDLHAQQIDFCKVRHAGQGIEFLQGNAMELPFDDGSFDLVSNVESSHLYSDMRQFLQDVYRVLRPGGLFLFTDLRSTLWMPILELELEHCDMQVVRSEDITNKVLAACDLDGNRFKHVFGSDKSALPVSIAQRKAAAYRSGRFKYVSYVLRAEK
jgi:ubiquinone/menaquinone biosynthesis C-methylase UbiE